MKVHRITHCLFLLRGGQFVLPPGAKTNAPGGGGKLGRAHFFNSETIVLR